MINEAILDAAARLQARDAAKKLPPQKNVQSPKWMQTAKSGRVA
jgi:ribosomal protein S19E (S16A)